MGNTMKHFSIDEDTMNALMELLSDAYVEACHLQDKGSISFYAYLLGELENAKCVGKTEPLSKDEEIKMKKIERYLRMLQRGLENPDDEEDNEMRKKYARDILENKDKNKIPKIDKDSKVTEVMKVTKMTPYFSTNMSLCQIEDILKKITNLSEYEKYKIYVSERDRRQIGESLDMMCKDIGIKRAEK
jgi:hypothetical protein